MPHPWQYDESVQVGTDYRDEKEVRAYDRYMQKLRDVDKEAKEIAKALAVGPDFTVWEIGTGTGECALAIASQVEFVYATDVSPVMLEYACRKAEQRQISNVRFEKGGFLSGFRPDRPVDGIVTQLALHHLPDFWKARAMDGLARGLRPGGRLYLRDVVFPSAIDNHDAFFRTAIEEVKAKAGDEVAEQTIQHIKEEFSTLDWILEGMMTRSGLRIIEKGGQGFLWVYVCEK